MKTKKDKIVLFSGSCPDHDFSSAINILSFLEDYHGILYTGTDLGTGLCSAIGLQNLFVINTALTQKKSRVYATALIVIFFDVTLL